MIGGHRIRIEVADVGDDWGRSDFEGRVISVSVKACGTKKNLRETLRHEMMHIALSCGGVTWAEKWDEELVVRCLENLFWPAWDRMERSLRRKN